MNYKKIFLNMPGFKGAVWHAQFLKEEKWFKKKQGGGIAFGNCARKKNQKRKYRASKIKIYNLQATESKDLQPFPATKTDNKIH